MPMEEAVISFKAKARIRKTPPAIRKNIYGYYEHPQFHNNQPNLHLTKHPNRNKAIQTIPEDLSIICVRPIIKITVIDGKIKPQRNRHRLDFYVRIHYNQEQFIDTPVEQSL